MNEVSKLEQYIFTLEGKLEAVERRLLIYEPFGSLLVDESLSLTYPTIFKELREEFNLRLIRDLDAYYREEDTCLE
jgi:hypothetical protein